MWFDKVSLRNLLMILEERYPHSMTEEEIKPKLAKIAVRQEDLYRYLHFCHERELVLAGGKEDGAGRDLYPVRITHLGIAYVHDLR